MSNSLIRALVIGLLSVVAALLTSQMFASNVAIQIGGSDNKIEQKIDPVAKQTN
jgi:hypothetical protein